MEPKQDRSPDYAEPRRTADVHPDPQERHAAARDHVREARREPAPEAEPRARARIAGWPWLGATLVALAFFAWLIYAVWFS